MTASQSKTDSPYRTLADFRAKNAAEGYNFFSRDTMRWWHSRIESTLIRGRWFITSEQEFAFDGREPGRIYCVRYAEDDGSTYTLRSYIRDKDDARDLIKRVLAGEHVKANQRCKVCGEFGEACTGAK